MYLMNCSRLTRSTERESEIDEQHLAPEILVGPHCSRVVDKGEGTADRLAVPHQDIHELRGRANRGIIGQGSPAAGKHQQQKSGGEAHFHGSINRDPTHRR
jgi:hypothetical protein